MYIRLTEPAINDVSRAGETEANPDSRQRGKRMTVGTPSVCVIIPAWNAAATIDRAVRSALMQPEVAEVIVVDDCSTDDTAAVAEACVDKGGRLHVLRQVRNQGPAAARNRAIAQARADFIALLDSDDFLLPGRFAPLLAIEGWDMIADNIVFVRDDAIERFDAGRIADFDSVPERIDLENFINGNVSRPGHPRAELGFAKPVMRRAFMARHGLSYDETLRLGEDYALYLRMLALGAEFMRVRRCGYVAVERANSLSGGHTAADLGALLAFDRAFAATTTLAPGARAALERHIRQLRIKAGYRSFLDTKRAAGLAEAMALVMQELDMVPGIAAALLRDKLPLAAQTPAPPAGEVRYLFA